MARKGKNRQTSKDETIPRRAPSLSSSGQHFKDTSITAFVDVNNIQYGQYSPQPAMSEVQQAAEQGVEPWIEDILELNSSMDREECDSFLRVVAEKLHYNFTPKLEDQLRLVISLGAGGRPVHARKQLSLDIDQERALTGFWIWTCAEYVTRKQIAGIFNVFIPYRRPYVHSLECDDRNMCKIAAVIKLKFDSITEKESKDMMRRPLGYVCGNAHVPAANDNIEIFSNIEDGDFDGHELECGAGKDKDEKDQQTVGKNRVVRK